MAQIFSKEAIEAKKEFVNIFLASVEEDRATEKANGTSDPEVEDRRRTLFDFSSVVLKQEL